MALYGLLGGTLGHSFSPQIHNLLASYEYRLFPMPEEDVKPFLEKHEFEGINVTIPYKETVIPYCDSLSDSAKKLKSVNTIIVKDSKLHGDNTDYYGFTYMVKNAGIVVNDKKCIVLGSGGSSKTICAVLKDLGASGVTVISRSGEDNYNNIDRHYDADIIVNTTPVGMYPKTGVSCITLDNFKNCKGVLDIIYNPAKTKLILDAQRLGIPHSNGLPMLVAQAKKACELFLDKKINDSEINRIVKIIENQTKNIILIGMPGSGKSSVGKIIAEKLQREFIDTDDEIERIAEKPIPQIFEEDGEEKFREIETRALEESSKLSGKIIATGGGIVKLERNHNLLKQNSIIVFLARDSEKLSTDNRPLSKDADTLKMLYDERIAFYKALCDFEIDSNNTVEDAVNSLLEVTGYENPCN